MPQAAERHGNGSLAAVGTAGNVGNGVGVPVAADEQKTFPAGKGGKKIVDSLGQLFPFQFLLRRWGAGNQVGKLAQKQREISAAPFFGTIFPETVQGQISGNGPYVGIQPLWTGRGNGVPYLEVCIVQAFFHILLTAENILRDPAAVGAICIVEQLDRLGIPGAKQPYNLLCVHPTTPFTYIDTVFSII